jgi:Ni/Co efflux regulator RcnB
MKRFVIASMAALMAVSTLGVTAASADPWDHRDHRGDDRRGDGDRDRDGDHDRDRDRDHRWDRNHRDWDDRYHNGYSYNGRWFYGPPPPAYYGRVDYGYHSWRRGDRLPDYYRDRYSEVDYYRYHLRPPPRGYHYVRDDRGEILLVGLATGVILSAILNDRY